MRYAVLAAAILLALAVVLAGWTWDEDHAQYHAGGSTIIA